MGEKTAIVEMRRAIEAHEAALGAPQLDRAVTLEAAAADWLHHLEHVDGAKPSTLADYRYMLAVPDAQPCKRGRSRPGGRVMRAFGGRELGDITTDQVERWLAGMDRGAVSKRTINKYRELVCSVLEFAAAGPSATGSRPTSSARPPSGARPRPAPWTSTTTSWSSWSSARRGA